MRMALPNVKGNLSPHAGQGALAGSERSRPAVPGAGPAPNVDQPDQRQEDHDRQDHARLQGRLPERLDGPAGQGHRSPDPPQGGSIGLDGPGVGSGTGVSLRPEHGPGASERIVTTRRLTIW